MTAHPKIRLDDNRFFTFLPGLWRGKKQPFTTAAVLRSTNFAGDGLVDYGNVVVLDVEERQVESRRLQPGDMIIERSGGGPKQAVGRVALFDPPDDRDYATSNFTTILRITDKRAFDPEFVSLFLHALYLSGATESLQRATTGIRNLDWSAYQSFEVPQLPIEDQRVVANLLTRCRNSVRTQSLQISALADLKRTAMHRLFSRGVRRELQKETEIGAVPESWVIQSIGTAFHIVQGVSLKGNLSDSAEGTAFLRTSNVYWGELDLSSISRMHIDPTIVGDRWLTHGDLLVCEGGEVGRAAVWKGDIANCTYQNHLHRLRPIDSSRVDAEFVAAWLEVGFLHREVYAGAANKTTIPNLSRARLAELSIPIPPIEEQRDIAAILSAIDKKLELHRRKRVVFDDLFKSLLHKLMMGEMVLADLNLSALRIEAAEEAAA